MAGELVVCYDGSEGAQAALAKAIALAPVLGAGLVIAYGCDVSRVEGELLGLSEALHERGARLTAEGLATARSAGIDARSVVLEGSPAAAIASFAEAEGAAMIVSGTRGERPLTGVLVGALPQKLLHLSSVPVLAVPH